MFADFLNNALLPGLSGMICVPATYYPATGDPVACNVDIDFDSDLRPDNIDIGVIEVGITIEALISDVGIPKHGDTFEIDGFTYRVARLDSKDNVFVKVVVTEVTL